MLRVLALARTVTVLVPLGLALALMGPLWNAFAVAGLLVLALALTVTVPVALGFALALMGPLGLALAAALLWPLL